METELRRGYSGTARRKGRQQTNRTYCHRATFLLYRPPVATNDRFADAKREDCGPAVGQLWSGPSGRYGSARDSHAIELTAGKLTSKSNYRTADACGRQWPVTCCRSG